MSRLVKQNLETLRLGEEVVEFAVVRSRRRSLQIMIFPPGKMEVRAPLSMAKADIDRFIAAKARWIKTKLGEFRKTAGQIIDEGNQNGSLHSYLGKTCSLSISPAIKNQVWIEGDLIRIHSRNTDEDYIARLIFKWKIAESGRLFQELVSKYFNRLEGRRGDFPVIKTRRMKTRWGSCSSKNIITLNLELIRYPIGFIEYVVAHEVSHLVELNHSRRFYTVLESILPDWKEKKKLGRNAGF